MAATFPRKGLLSGMVVVALGLGAALVVGLFLPGWQAPFAVEPSRALVDAFGVSIGVMVLHKIECWVFREVDVCPVYLTLEQDAPTRSVRETEFLLMIPPLMGGLVLVALVMRGPPWPMLLIGAWLTQALHEVHHLGKSIASRSIYPGLWTALAFVITMDLFVAWPWFQEVGAAQGWWGFVAAQVVLVGAFAVEHAGWRGRYEVWRAETGG